VVEGAPVDAEPPSIDVEAAPPQAVEVVVSSEAEAIESVEEGLLDAQPDIDLALPQEETPLEPVLVDAAPPEPSRPEVAPPVAAAAPGSETDALIDALASASDAGGRVDALLRLGRSGDMEALDAIRPWIGASDPALRATAFEAIGRLLEREPAQLEPFLHSGLGDPDPRVRRRVALAAATARGLPLRALLDLHQDDPDAQVRRVVLEVLRHAPARAPHKAGTRERTRTPTDDDLAHAGVAAEAVPSMRA
jgi:hypothetical protein